MQPSRRQVAIVLCSLTFAASVSGEEHLIDVERSTITVQVSKSGLLGAFADNHIIRAPLTEGAIEDTPHVQILVDVRRMEVLDPGLSPKDRQDVQRRMLGPDVLDVDGFPRIHFHSVAIRLVGPQRWRVEGELEIHGQIHPATVSVALEQGHYKGSTSVRQSAFGIAPISIAGGAVKVKDAVQVDFDIVAAEPRTAAHGARASLPSLLYRFAMR